MKNPSIQTARQFRHALGPSAAKVNVTTAAASVTSQGLGRANARPNLKRYVSAMIRAIAILFTILVSAQAPATEQTEMAFTSIVFNYWCQTGSPPGSSRDLSLVVDLEELDAYLDFDPDKWSDSVRFEMEGNVQKITFPVKESSEGGSITTTSFYTTHKCSNSEET